MANPRAISTNPPLVHLEASGVLSLSFLFMTLSYFVFLFVCFLWLIQALSALTTLSLSFVYPSLSYFVFFFVANPRAINTNPLAIHLEASGVLPDSASCNVL